MSWETLFDEIVNRKQTLLTIDYLKPITALLIQEDLGNRQSKDQGLYKLGSPLDIPHIVPLKAWNLYSSGLNERVDRENVEVVWSRGEVVLINLKFLFITGVVIEFYFIVGRDAGHGGIPVVLHIWGARNWPRKQRGPDKGDSPEG